MSLPPPGSPSESPGRAGLGWSGPGPQLPRAGLLPSNPRRDTRNCFSGRAGVVPGRERPGHWPSRPAWLPQPCSGGRSAEASRPPSAGSVRLGCAAHLHGGPTPLASGAGGRSPRILLGLRMIQGRGMSRSPSSRVLEEWGRGCLQQEALLGQRTMAPSLRARAPLPGRGLERKAGAAPPFCARFQGTSGFRPFCIFESESLHSAVSGEEPAEM